MSPKAVGNFARLPQAVDTCRTALKASLKRRAAGGAVVELCACIGHKMPSVIWAHWGQVVRGCGSVVERPLRMRKAPGSIPGISNLNGAAGVVVSCKIPILATRVRFPGGALFFLAQLNRKTASLTRAACSLQKKELCSFFTSISQNYPGDNRS